MKPTIATFYSYKGGVGRTAALSNVGVVVAQLGYGVLLVDLDLEAPGLDQYISNMDKQFGLSAEVDFPTGMLYMLRELKESDTPDYAGLSQRHTGVASLPTGETLSVLRSGRHVPHYASDLADFDWISFFDRGAPSVST